MTDAESDARVRSTWLITFFTFLLITTMTAASHLVNARVTASLQTHIAKRRQVSRNAPEWCGTTVQWNTGSGQNICRNTSIIKWYQISIGYEYWFSYYVKRFLQEPTPPQLPTWIIFNPPYIWYIHFFIYSYSRPTYPAAIEFAEHLQPKVHFLQISNLLPLHDLPVGQTANPGEPFK